MHFNNKKTYLSVLLCTIATTCNTPYLKAADKESKKITIPTFSITENNKSFWQSIKEDKLLTLCVIPSTMTLACLALYDEQYKPLCKNVIKYTGIFYFLDRSAVLIHELSHAAMAHYVGKTVEHIHVSSQFLGNGCVEYRDNKYTPENIRYKNGISISLAGPVGGVVAGMAISTFINCFKPKTIDPEIMHSMAVYVILSNIENAIPDKNHTGMDGSQALENFAKLQYMKKQNSPLTLREYEDSLYDQVPYKSIKALNTLIVFKYARVMTNFYNQK